MNKIILTGLALALCAPAFAQTKSFTSPAGFKTSEGAHYAYYIFYSPNGKHHVAEGEFQGGAKVFTGLQFRRDSTYSATTYRNQGRKFKTFNINMGECDFTKITTNHATNFTKTPTNVYTSTNFSLPTLTGFPLIKNPAVWGGVKGEWNFTFSKVWLYAGKTDFLVEYATTGGTFDNGYTTTYGLTYYLDGEYINTNSAYMPATYVPTTRVTNCSDPTITYTYGAYTYAYGYVYGNNGSVVNYRKKAVVYGYGYYVTDGRPVIQAWGLPNTAGVNVGAKCNKLYINFTFPTALFPFKAVSGVSGYTGQYIHVLPWLEGLMNNLTVACQHAWQDSVSGQLGLTQAVTLKFPNSPPPDQLPKRKSVYQSGTYTYLSPNDGYITPITHYQHK